jgi:hypothetical protein
LFAFCSLQFFHVKGIKIMEDDKWINAGYERIKAK